MRRRYECPTRYFIRQLISLHPRSSTRGGWTERPIWTQLTFHTPLSPTPTHLRKSLAYEPVGRPPSVALPVWHVDPAILEVRLLASSLGHRSFPLICRRPINTALRLTLGLCGSDRILLRQPLFSLPHRLVFSAILVSTSSFSVSQQARVTFFLHRGSGS